MIVKKILCFKKQLLFITSNNRIVIIIIVNVINLALQSRVDLGLQHNSLPIQSISGLHSPRLDAHLPGVLLHVCYPAIPSSSSLLCAVHSFTQDPFRCTMINHTLQMTQPTDPENLTNLKTSSWPRMDSKSYRGTVFI